MTKKKKTVGDWARDWLQFLFIRDADDGGATIVLQSLDRTDGPGEVEIEMMKSGFPTSRIFRGQWCYS